MPIFEEVKFVNQVTVLPQQNSVNVQWSNVIKKDGEIISQQYHRKAYGPGQREEFLAEVEGAENYVNLIDWTVTQQGEAQ